MDMMYIIIILKYLFICLTRDVNLIFGEIRRGDFFSVEGWSFEF